MSTPKKHVTYRSNRLTSDNIEDLREELQRELDLISRVIESLSSFDLYPLGAEPEKFKEGSLRFFLAGVSVTGIASTTAGLHQFRGGAWRPLAES